MPSSSRKTRAGAINSDLSSATRSTSSKSKDRRSSPRLKGQSPEQDIDRLATAITSMTPEHKTKKLPVSNKRRKKTTCHLVLMPENMLICIFEFFVSEKGIDIDSYLSLIAVSKACRDIAKSQALWKPISMCRGDNSLNEEAFQLVKVKCKGTEGTCIHARWRPNNRAVALKRARVYPDNEGVPYYMMREISTLKKMSHPNISPLENVALKNFKLYLFFPYVENTLHDYLVAPTIKDHDGNEIRGMLAPPKKHQTLSIMHQVCSAVAYLHRKGVLHRNLKPKHLLVQPGPILDDPLEGATVQLTDFALVRTLNTPPKVLTSEVITLWYRPPEILMGERKYTAAVDIWSLGCIFAELLQGKALFEGLCEIDQLFQIFRTLGTPNDSVWSNFSELPNFQPTIFPQWDQPRLRGKLTGADPIEYELLLRCLAYDPVDRISAEQILTMPYFHLKHNREPAQHAVIDRITSEVPTSDVLSKKEVIEESSRIVGEGELVNLFPTTLPQLLFQRSLESSMVVSPSKVDVDKMFTSDDLTSRGELVEGLLRISGPTSSGLSSRTSYFAVALADTFFVAVKSSEMVPRENPWTFTESALVVGACCMHIASKCEDVSYVGIKDISFLLGLDHELSYFLNIEEVVLTTLGFDLYIPTVIDFLGIYMDCIPELCDKEEQRSLCRYLGHLSLFNGMTLRYKPSVIAATIVSYALRYDSKGARDPTQNEWPKSLALATSLSFERDICPCLVDLSEYQRLAAQAPSGSAVGSIHTGYSVSLHHGVSRWHWLQ